MQDGSQYRNDSTTFFNMAVGQQSRTSFNPAGVHRSPRGDSTPSRSPNHGAQRPTRHNYSPATQRAAKRNPTVWPGFTPAEHNNRRTDQYSNLNTNQLPTPGLTRPNNPVRMMPDASFSPPSTHATTFEGSTQAGSWQATNMASRAPMGAHQAPMRPYHPSVTPPLSPNLGRNGLALVSPSSYASMRWPAAYSPIVGPAGGGSSIPIQPPTAFPGDTAQQVSNPSPVPIYSVARTVSPIRHHSSLNLFLSPERLAQELEVESRHGVRWENWEHTAVIRKFAGPGSSLNLFIVAMNTPLKPTADKVALLDPAWCEAGALSVVTFNGVRTVTTLVRQWGLLVATYYEIIRFAQSMGTNTYSPEFDDTHVLVERIVALWKMCVPSGTWGALKQAQMAAWTNDSKNGWLAMMHKRMREMNHSRPTVDTIDSPDSPRRATPANHSGRNQLTAVEHGYNFPSVVASPPAPIATTDSAGNDVAPGQVEAAEQAQPDQSHPLGPQDPGLPSTCSHAEEQAADISDLTAQDFADTWDMMREQDTTNDDPFFVGPTPAGPAYPPARVGTLGWALDRELQERRLRLKFALYLADRPNNKNGLRESAADWVKTTFLSTHPSQDFTQLLGECRRGLGLTHPTAAQAPPPPVPPMDFPDSLDLIDPTFPMPATPTIPPMSLMS